MGVQIWVPRTKVPDDEKPSPNDGSNHARAKEPDDDERTG
jgi:hypothetical protein